MEEFSSVFICCLFHSKQYTIIFFFLIFFFFFFFDCVGSSFLCEGLLQLRQAGATLHRGARASHHRGLSCCGAQAPDAQAQQLWLTGPAAPRHAGSSQTRARPRVPCIGRRILNHCATREALHHHFLWCHMGYRDTDGSLLDESQSQEGMEVSFGLSGLCPEL